MPVTKLIRQVLIIFPLLAITVLSVSGQKNCGWESFSSFQEKYSREIKKSSIKDGENYLEKINFVDEKRGWISGTNFTAATTNGGKTWKIKRIEPAVVNEIYFADQSKGWHTLVSESSEVKIYQTLDGGKTWKYLKQISESFVVKSDPRVFGYVPTILKVRFINDDVVWSVGLKKVGDTMQYAIWKTSDGGKTWETKYLSKDSVIQKTLEASFIRLTEKRIIVSSNGLILLSEDNGESWQATANLNVSKTATPDFFKDFDFAEDTFVRAITGINGKNFQSLDGGKTWLPHALGMKNEDSYKFTNIKFSNRQAGWIAGSQNDGKTAAGIILSTTDGGNTWIQAYRATAPEIIALSKTSKYLFAVGNNGLLLKYSIVDCLN